MLILTINRLVVGINLLILQSSIQRIGFDFWVRGLRLDKCTKEEWEVLINIGLNQALLQSKGIFIAWTQVQNVSKFGHGGLRQQIAHCVSAYWTWFDICKHWHDMLAYRRASWFTDAYISSKLLCICLGFWRLYANPWTIANTRKNS